MIPTDAPIVKRGQWLYGGLAPCEVRIVKHNVMYGSGDCEDPPDISDDREVECYYLLFQTPVGQPEWVDGGAALSVVDAVSIAESKLAATLTWID